MTSASAILPAARLWDWSERLNAYLLSARRLPHDYGTHDCLLHPAGGVYAVTGVDLGAAHRGAYNSQASAVRYLRSLGFDSPEAMLDSLFGEVPIGFAQRGDLILTPPSGGGDWAIPGVCVGAVTLCVSPAGFVREPRRRWLKAWRVGR